VIVVTQRRLLVPRCAFGLLDPRQDREGVSNQQAAIMQSVTVEDAVDMIPHGASVMIGGFMGVGTPERIIDRNYNPVIAMAADWVIATADHVVPAEVIAPDHVITPATVVDYLVLNA
jgi:acyl CoA:acetate/3-ketoacid CoA transferase alpha subunit